MPAFAPTAERVMQALGILMAPERMAATTPPSTSRSVPLTKLESEANEKRNRVGNFGWRAEVLDGRSSDHRPHSNPTPCASKSRTLIRVDRFQNLSMESGRWDLNFFPAGVCTP
jgi:hypothetical protein